LYASETSAGTFYILLRALFFHWADPLYLGDMKKKYLLPGVLLVLILPLGLPLAAQYDWPSLSPPGKLTQTIGQTTVTLEYERPAARGRKIYGGLVPWDKVWRTGAGYCTRLGFDREVRLGGQTVPAGKYSLFTIPRPEYWTIILNRDTTLYGSSDYDPAQDAIRFDVPARKSGRFYESLTIDVDITPNDAEIYISWTDVTVHFPLETHTSRRMMDYVRDQLLTGQTADNNDYGMAAEELLLAKEELNTALSMANKYIEVEPQSGWGYRLKAEILAHMGYYERAIMVMDEVIKMRQEHPFAEAQQQAWDLAEWRRMRREYADKQ
jgi:hypothetical protein